MPAANYNATVLANGAAGENVMLLTARWDETTPAPACGQFYMLRAWKAEEAPLLSRPISVHRFDREKKEISFLYEVRGTGTQKLAALRPGDTVALTGPSGRGFPVDGTLGGCCFSKRMRKVFKKNEKSMLQFCNKNSKKRAFTMG